MPAYKYAERMSGLGECPPQHCSPASGEAFRFVHKPLGEASFVPTALLKPGRENCCKGWALSLFTNAESAIRRYRGLVAKYPKIVAELGDHLARGKLLPSDGVATDPDDTSHFSLYEFAACDLSSSFQIDRKL